ALAETRTGLSHEILVGAGRRTERRVTGVAELDPAGSKAALVLVAHLLAVCTRGRRRERAGRKQGAPPALHRDARHPGERRGEVWERHPALRGLRVVGGGPPEPGFELALRRVVLGSLSHLVRPDVDGTLALDDSRLVGLSAGSGHASGIGSGVGAVRLPDLLLGRTIEAERRDAVRAGKQTVLVDVLADGCLVDVRPPCTGAAVASAHADRLQVD